ncbi:Antibiotic biosynthesis monooxygenase [Desulfovibrio sp. X2]|uniref:antibiotic biosynthesis monooxygenase family protein n=1 Tax=Desulfovibrio sp. X2 TaxID=941449 RepID=UPI000358834A|nr:antibiotic biosynthesis monooxygenase family protein [Desulfovibrio sp. X2]EPR43951.1 Antibiotic biosynthesis monooxygenase [Desulfovibrio sp. X2]
MSHVTLINPFEVPEGQEGEFLAFWEKAAAYLRRQPGFLSTRLHRAVAHGARFGFVNMTEWESADHFQKAVAAEDFMTLVGPYMDVFPHYPALYHVARGYPEED